MKILDRLALLKAGYTKDEINEMIKADVEDQKSEQEDDSTSEQTDKYADIITALANEVKELKTSIQKENIKNSEMSTGAHTVDDAMNVLASLINPDFNKGEENK